MTNFQINHHWKLRDELIEFFHFPDESKVFSCLHHFLAVYQGKFVVCLDRYEAPFELDPDLSTVFREIPGVLEQLATDTEENVELNFFEQGTDVGILMKRKSNFIDVSFDTGTASGVPFRHLPNQIITVEVKLFLTEWTKFLLAVLQSMADLEPEITSEETYQVYQNRINAISQRYQTMNSDSQ